MKVYAQEMPQAISSAYIRMHTYVYTYSQQHNFRWLLVSKKFIMI